MKKRYVLNYIRLESNLIFFCVVITFLALISPWFWKGLYGFDWEDTTYHFQQALNVYNGDVIGDNLRSHVPGLSFWIEAQLFNYFGAEFLVHRTLGLIFPFITMVSLSMIFSFSFKYMRLQNKIVWVLALSSMAVVSFWGQQIYFSFTFLAGAISFLLAALVFVSWQTKSIYIFIVCFALVSIGVSVQILVKQSHGYLNFLICNFFLFLYFWLWNGKKILLLIAPTIFSTAVVGCVLYLESIFCNGCFQEMILYSSDSMALKGLNPQKPLEIFSTLIGINSIKTLLAFCFVVLIFGFGVYAVKRFQDFSNHFILALPVLAFVIYKFSWASVGSFYVSVALLGIQIFFIYCNGLSFSNRITLASGKVEAIGTAIFIAQIPLLGSILAEQLSWPGPHYAQSSLTLPLITMQAVSILLLLRIRINGFINPAIAFVLYIAISILIISPKPRLFDGINEGLTQLSGPESFSNWKVSPQTASAIRELQSESRSCPGDQLFQLAWMPIAYEITNRKNITGYDLPYHDTITLDEARNILLMLLSNPPGMLLVQERHANYQGPFPALGMKYLYENISELIKNYELMSIVSDNHNSVKVYCYKP